MIQPGKLYMYEEGNDGKNRKGAKQNIKSIVRATKCNTILENVKGNGNMATGRDNKIPPTNVTSKHDKFKG